MKYKDCLFFIAKSLTLDAHPEKIEEVKKEIQNNLINWEDVVRLSSGQFVLPAFYLSLKRNGLSDLLPVDLLEYFEEITQLNRARNKAILDQSFEINTLLNDHNITPVFLKGVAHLMAGLYNDMAERMIGDIDFLVPEEEMVKAAELLIEKGYQPLVEYQKEMFRELKHYPRLQNFNKPSSVEIHKNIIATPNYNLLKGFDLYQNKVGVRNGTTKTFIPCSRHLVIHNVYNAQLNDRALNYGDILLRQMYDLYLLAQNCDIMEIAREHGKRFNLFNTYFSAADLVFSYPKKLEFHRTFINRYFLIRLKLFLSYPSIARINKTIMYFFLRFTRYITLPIHAITQREVRRSLSYRLKNPKWYAAHIKSYFNFFRQQKF